MKRVLIALALGLATPLSVAQAPGATEIEVEGKGLINSWIALFNKGDAAALAKNVYTGTDEATLAKRFVELRADSFGKLDVYNASFCGIDSTHGKALLTYARIYTFGGKMNDDEATLFDLVKTSEGWRISGEKETSFSATLSCS